jgi:predicted RNase H-like HicB family nuclease
MTLEEHLAVPYVLCLESVARPDGDWVRRACYPELPGCVGEGATPFEAIERLEQARVQFITERLAQGAPIPVPRPPLRTAPPPLNAERLGFTRWLVEQKRLSEGTPADSTDSV